MRRALIVLTVLAALLAAPAAAQSPSFQKDSARDGRGKLDLVRVALGPRAEGELRGEITMQKPWTTADLREGGGPSGSICLQLWMARRPGDEPPDYLVCATPAPTGDELRGRVLRDRSNGLPRQVGAAIVTRPTSRTVYLRFAPAHRRSARRGPLRRRGGHARAQVPAAARLPGHRAGRSRHAKSDLALALRLRLALTRQDRSEGPVEDSQRGLSTYGHRDGQVVQ